MSAVQAVRKNEPRQIIVVLGEGGVPAQRFIQGVTYLELADGSRTPDEPYNVEVTVDQVQAYFDSVVLNADTLIRAANDRAAQAVAERNVAVEAANHLQAIVDQIQNVVKS
jgi:predicted nucleic acid-binding protein